MGVVGLDGAQDGFGGGVGRPEGRVVKGEVGEENTEEEGSGYVGGGLVGGVMGRLGEVEGGLLTDDDHEGAELVATHFGSVSRVVSSRLVSGIESVDREVRE